MIAYSVTPVRIICPEVLVTTCCTVVLAMIHLTAVAATTT